MVIYRHMIVESAREKDIIKLVISDQLLRRNNASADDHISKLWIINLIFTLLIKLGGR